MSQAAVEPPTPTPTPTPLTPTPPLRLRERTAGWALRRRLAVTFGVLALVISAFLTVGIVSTVTFVRRADDVIYRWQPAVVNVQKLLVNLLDQETGMRGYVLTRNETFLQPYDQAVTAEPAIRARLGQLVAGDRPLEHDLDAVLAAADQWQHDVALPAISETRAGSADGRRLAEEVSSKTRFDSIRSSAQTLSDEVVARTLTARASRNTAAVVFVVSLSLTALVVLLGGFVLWRGLRRWVLNPIDRLAAETRAVSDGELYREISPEGPRELVELGADVEAMRRRITEELVRAEETQHELRRQGAELERSNEDLQQFAYVASHDLSEPLRKVANFCQLLERQYAEHLDDRANQYIYYAVDGAKRMQVLITDLLALSRVGRNTESFVPVELTDVATQAVATLADRIAEAEAVVELPEWLPTVVGDRTLLLSLFENLIGNAVKYRRPDVAPHVVVRVEHDADRPLWRFTVADNGIGIDQQYAERIFAVFQRLHVRERYEGTGIGLALCRRIVEFHGGQIRLAPVQSDATPVSTGATFELTLPDSPWPEGGPVVADHLP